MKSQQEITVETLINIHKWVRQILMGDKTLAEENVEVVKNYVKEHGLEGIFKPIDDLLPEYDEPLDLDDDLELNDEDDECNDFEDEELLLPAELLDKGKYVKISEYSVSSYLRDSMSFIDSSAELSEFSDHLKKLEILFDEKGDKEVAARFIDGRARILYALRRYDDAIEQFTRILDYAEAKYGRVFCSASDSGFLELLNSYFMAKKEPPEELMIICASLNWDGGSLWKAVEKFAKCRLQIEKEMHGGEFFKWIESPIESSTYRLRGMLGRISRFEDEDRLNRLFDVKPLQEFWHTKVLNEFRKKYDSEMRKIIKIGKEFKDLDFVSNMFCEKLEWLRAVREANLNEDVIFAYETAWTWKFCFDLFFPSKQLAVVFHVPESYDDALFLAGRAGKVQHCKEWGRVVSKARRKYGMKVAYIPVNTEKSNIAGLIASCENGEFSL